MPKPSEVIKGMIPVIAQGRLDRLTRGTGRILHRQEEARMLASIQQEPITWVMGILAYLDKQQALPLGKEQSASQALEGSTNKPKEPTKNGD